MSINVETTWTHAVTVRRTVLSLWLIWEKKLRKDKSYNEVRKDRPQNVSVLLEIVVNEARTRVYVPRGNFRWWKLQKEHSRHWVADCVDMIRAFCIEPARILRKLNILKITARRKSSIAEDVDDSVCQCQRARRESHHNNTTIQYEVRDVPTEDGRERREWEPVESIDIGIYRRNISYRLGRGM